MAKKKELKPELKDLKSKLQEGKAVVGKDRVMKALRANKLENVFLAGNCPDDTKEDINHYAKLSECPIIELDLSNEELGVFCKKNFFVSVIGTTK